jgi:peptidoglycan/xylan/chitin deacetylase (PgdA/CDA1 family)
MKSEPVSRPLLVTTSWDDGHPSDLRVADLLDKHGITGTFYIPCSNSEGRPVMPATDIVRLGSRFEIGGHTRDHVVLTAVAPELAEGQIRANRCRLEDLLGHEVRGFAYVRGHYNQNVRALVGNAGYSYARTVRNLMSTPGHDRYEVPTTVQFFPHRDSVYLRNYLSGGPSLQRSRILRAVMGRSELAVRLLRVAEACFASGGYFHLWGHSWELDEHDLWGELDKFLGHLRTVRSRFITNEEWSANLCQ